MILSLVASALWTGFSMSWMSGRQVLNEGGSCKVERAERSLVGLRRRLRGERTVGLLSWYQDPAKLFEIQYVLAPVRVRRGAKRQDLLLVELGPGKKVNYNQKRWRLAARAEDERYWLLSRIKSPQRAGK